MEERGFDALQKGNGPAVLILGTILILAFIVAGGLFFRFKEAQWRAEHSEHGTSNDDSPKAV